MWLPRLDDKKVKDQMNTSKEDKRKREKQVKDKNKGLVVMPYIQGISESFNRVLKKHNVSTVFTYVFASFFLFLISNVQCKMRMKNCQTAMRPHITVGSFVVDPQNKRSMDQTTAIVYKITCTDCDKAYVGETSIMFKGVH